MEDWQIRVVQERDDLEDKLSRLSQRLGAFSESLNLCTPDERYYDFAPNAKELLFRQQRVMLDYHQILTQRICLFKGN